jgi:hypothetical protein
MIVILENTETGELHELKDRGSFQRPWRIKEVIPEHKPDTNSVKVQLAVLGTKFGLPVPQLLDAARWLLKKNCPYCELGTEVLRKINELGEQQVQELITRILTAKASNDIDALNKIRQEVNNRG